MEDAKSEQAVKPMSGHLRDQPVFLQIYGNTRKLLVHLREGGLSTEKKPPNFREYMGCHECEDSSSCHFLDSF
uniref:Ovule protein n=1 Tax=Loa loa TaxID=7209 RepID=A0A1I7VN69_LOALO